MTVPLLVLLVALSVGTPPTGAELEPRMLRRQKALMGGL